MPLSRRFRLVALAFLVASCKKDDPIVATRLSLSTPPSATAQNRVVLATQPSVQLTDEDGRASPTAGVVVTATVMTAGAVITGTSTATTGASGVATFTDLAIQGTAGDHAIEFTAPNLASVSAPVTTTPGVATNIAVNAGNNQTATVNTAVATAPSVKVTDPDGNAVSGTAVSFTVSGGAGTVVGASQTTGTDGVATITSWTLGSVAGANTLQANSGTLTGSPVTITATGTPGSPTKIVFLQSMSATAQNRVAFTTQPSVRLQDQFSNNVSQSGVTVTASIALGGGTLQGTTSVATNADGVAAFTNLAVAGSTGSRTLAFSSSGLSGTSAQVTTTAGVATTIAVNAGNNQSGQTGQAVPTPPSVKVTDADGNLVSGVAVNWAVASGGGSVTPSTSSTNSSGVATVTSWTLGASAGTNTLTATSSGLTGSPVTFTATGGTSAFDIQLVYLTSVTAAQEAAFNNAVTKWKSAITADIGDVFMSSAANSCRPAISGETIDDLRIYVTIENIDGAGNVLGSAGPCDIRSGSFLPVTGHMTFDSADLATLELNGLLTDVIKHEMGHVLGIGTIWGPFHKNLISGAGTSNPVYTGTEGIAQCKAIDTTACSANTVPVENSGGGGTADAHWEDDVFTNELMTGFVNLGSNPMSVITIGSVKDLGYTVNLSAADAYTAPFIAGPTPTKLHLVDDILKFTPIVLPDVKPGSSKPPTSPRRQ